MLLFHWLASVRNRLRLSRYFGSQRKLSRPRGRHNVYSCVPAMVESLEPRRVMSAVSAVDDALVTRW